MPRPTTSTWSAYPSTTATSRCAPVGCSRSITASTGPHTCTSRRASRSPAGWRAAVADAAATLVALDRLWSLDTADDDLLALAAELGSDVPFALVGGTARGSGRGEVVSPLADDSSLWWVVVPDAEGLSTAEVYAEFARAPGIGSGRPSPDWSDLDYAGIGRALRNDLQDPALRLRPELATARDALTSAGADAVLLSGSGPTYLGLVSDRDAAHDVVDRLIALGLVGVRIATGPVAGAHVVEYV